MAALLTSPDVLTFAFGALTALGTGVLFVRTVHVIRDEKTARHR